VSDDVSAVLPTFCHISELGPLGYGNLHRMLAMSRPLNLWAPSSVLLRDPGCKVTPEDFIRYVRNGSIRIVARKKWLTESRKRDKHPWTGARWDPYVDGEIRSILEEDEAQGQPRAQRRVVAAGPEQGWSRAQEYVENNPDAARDWEAVLRLDDSLIPPGNPRRGHARGRQAAGRGTPDCAQGCVQPRFRDRGIRRGDTVPAAP